MGFLDKAKQAANEMAAKADQAMANAGISGPAGAPGGMGANRAADAALRDFGLITWREAHGHPVDASEKERVLHTLQGLEAGGQLAPLRCTSPQGAGGLYGSPPPGAPPPPPGYAAQQATTPLSPFHFERRALLIVADRHKAQAAAFGAALDPQKNRVAVRRVLRAGDVLAVNDRAMRHEHERFLAPQAEGKQQRELGGDACVNGRDLFDDALELDGVAFPASVLRGAIGALEAGRVIDVVRERTYHARLPDPGSGIHPQEAQLLLNVG